jgi:signal transduction histidine kinase
VSPAATGPSDAFFRQIVLGMRNGVLAITRDGRIALANDEARRIFGFPDGQPTIGEPISTALRHRPDAARILASVFDLRHLPSRAELRLGPGGAVIGYTITLIRNDHDAVIGAAMFFKDLTRVEQLEERERLRDRLAAVGEMAAVIAHEVKNPLAGIEVMAGLLRRKVFDAPDAQAVLSDIIAEAKMANGIVQEVLEYVRPTTLHVAPASIGDAIHAAIQLADSKTRRGDIVLDVEVPDELPSVHADEQQVTQVFTNVLINAYEAMGSTGLARVRASRSQLHDGRRTREAVLVEIGDSGPGMDAEVERKMFEPFYSTKPKGSGLGLAIVRKIVDAHDGRLDIETAPGAGTTIRVTFPVHDDVENLTE